MSINNSLMTLAALAVIGLAASVHAAPAGKPAWDPDAVSVKVSLAGLDLNSEAGAKVVLRRIQNAARDICGPQPDDELDYDAQYNRCVNTIVDRAVVSLDNPMVTAMNVGERRPATIVAANRH